jgi:hypothetical protein
VLKRKTESNLSSWRGTDLRYPSLIMMMMMMMIIMMLLMMMIDIAMYIK